MILNLRVAEDQSVEIPDIGFHSLNERVGGYSRSLGQQKKSILPVELRGKASELCGQIMLLERQRSHGSHRDRGELNSFQTGCCCNEGL